MRYTINFSRYHVAARDRWKAARLVAAACCLLLLAVIVAAVVEMAGIDRSIVQVREKSDEIARKIASRRPAVPSKTPALPQKKVDYYVGELSARRFATAVMNEIDASVTRDIVLLTADINLSSRVFAVTAECTDPRYVAQMLSRLMTSDRLQNVVVTRQVIKVSPDTDDDVCEFEIRGDVR